MKEAQKAKMAPGDLLAIYQALDRVQALIEFNLDGTVVSANENFLRIFGYELDEIVGKHHRIFCDPDYVESDAYTELWKSSDAASTTPRSSRGWRREARRFGSRPPTTRCSTRTENRSGS